MCLDYRGVVVGGAPDQGAAGIGVEVLGGTYCDDLGRVVGGVGRVRYPEAEVEAGGEGAVTVLLGVFQHGRDGRA